MGLYLDHKINEGVHIECPDFFLEIMVRRILGNPMERECILKVSGISDAFIYIPSKKTVKLSHGISIAIPDSYRLENLFNRNTVNSLGIKRAKLDGYNIFCHPDKKIILSYTAPPATYTITRKKFKNAF